MTCFIAFEDLGKAYDKAKKVVDKEGAVPKFYVSCLAELEDYVNEVSFLLWWINHMLFWRVVLVSNLIFDFKIVPTVWLYWFVYC